MSEKRLVIRGVAFNWLGRGVGFAIAFVVTPILIRGLGDEAYGLWSMVMALTSYYALADLGLRGAAVKHIAQYDAQHDQESVSGVVVTALAVYGFMAMVVLGVVAAAAMVFPAVVQTEIIDDASLGWVVLLTGLGVALTLIGQVFDASLTAAKRFDRSNMIAISMQILLATLMIVTVTRGWGILRMAMVTLAVTALNQATIFIVASWTLPYVKLSPRRFHWSTARTLFRFSILNFVQGVGRRAAKSAGTVIVGLILGPAVACFYAIAENLIVKTNELAQGITTVLLPLASQLDAQKRRAALAQTVLLAARVLTAMSLGLAVVFILFGEPLIDLWIGEGYAATAYPVLCVLAVANILRMSTLGLRDILLGTNRVGFLAKAGLADLGITIVCGVLFIKSGGLVGMAYAAVAAQLVTSAVLIPVRACRSVDIPIPRFLRETLIPAGLATLPALIAALTIKSFGPPARLSHLVIDILCVAALSAGSTFFICIDRRLRGDVFRSFLAGPKPPKVPREPIAEERFSEL